MAVIYTGGTFDLLHWGHINLLHACKKLAGEGGVVTVSLNTDEFVQEYKGFKPVQDYRNRARNLLKTGLVDYVIENSGGADSKPAIIEVRPDIIVIGSDWAKKNYYAQMGFTSEWLDDKAILLVYVPYTEGVSSTIFRHVMKEEQNVR